MKADKPGFHRFTVVVPIDAMEDFYQAKALIDKHKPGGLSDREPLAWGETFWLCAANLLANQHGYTLSLKDVFTNYEYPDVR